MGSSAQDPELKNIITILQSCIASTKQHLTVNQLNNDYKELIGTEIPFKKFQHGSLASFLQSIPHAVNIYNQGGTLFVKSVLNEKSANVSRLISGQKVSKSKGKFSRPDVIRRPVKSNWVPPQYKPQSYRGNNRRQYYNYHAPSPRPRGPNPVKKDILRNDRYSNSNSYTSHFPVNYQVTFNNNYSGNIPNQSKYSSNVPKPTNYSANVPKPTNYSANVPKPTNYSANVQKPVNYSEKVSNQFSVPSKPPTKIPNKIENPVKQPPTAPIVAKKYIKSNPITAKEKLVMECRNHDINCDIKYVTAMYGKKIGTWISKITVDERNFTSYPTEVKTMGEAEEVVANKALRYLREKSSSLSLPLTEDHKLAAKRIYSILEGHKVGVWWEQICKEYKEKFKERLNYSWIKEAPPCVLERISIHVPSENVWILSLKEGKNAEQNERDIKPLPLLTYPKQDFWKVYVTYIKDWTEVWFRLIGEEGKAYDELITNIELYFYEKDIQPVSSPVVGGFYACVVESVWFRVKVIKLSEGSKATVFCIDYGDEELVSTSSLFRLEPRFRELPAQSICSSMAGMEMCFGSDAVDMETARNMVLGQTLMAKVISRAGPVVSVVFYDTSTSEDINVNEQLLKMFPDQPSGMDFPPENGICEGYVTHVNSVGDFYFRIETATYLNLSDMLTTARKRAAEVVGTEEGVSINLERLYLAKFRADGEWHRAVPRSKSPNSEGTVLLEAIDVGHKEYVTVSDIVDLEKLNAMLTKIGPQTLLCRLYNTPSAKNRRWTSKASAKFLSLFPERSDVFCLKVVKSESGNTPTLVNLYRRDVQNRLASVNDILDMEDGIFSSDAEDSNNNFEDYLSFSDLKKPPIPEMSSYFDIVVTYAATPSNFAVQSYKKTRNLDWLMEELNSFYSNESNRKKKTELCKGGFYAVLHRDNIWYRAKIEMVGSENVSGTFIDYGDSFYGHTDNVQPLWMRFRDLPCQAYKAKIGGIAPINGDWMPEDSCRFLQLTENQTFVSVVTGVPSAPPGYSDTVPKLELKLIDTNDPTMDIYIDELFVNEKRAIRV